jgi:cyclophilin family peptidyl-prolyl cis-trans isomerase
MITIKTNHGDIKVDLFDDKAPITCENFRQYIADGFFNDTIFHRVIPNFMIQGGGMEAYTRPHKKRSRQRRE